jgi:hypothetical protein
MLGSRTHSAERRRTARIGDDGESMGLAIAEAIERFANDRARTRV